MRTCVVKQEEAYLETEISLKRLRIRNEEVHVCCVRAKVRKTTCRNITMPPEKCESNPPESHEACRDRVVFHGRKTQALDGLYHGDTRKQRQEGDLMDT